MPIAPTLIKKKYPPWVGKYCACGSKAHRMKSSLPVCPRCDGIEKNFTDRNQKLHGIHLAHV